MQNRSERCSVEGCPEGGRFKRGYCSLHYQRWLKYGDPGPVLRWQMPFNAPAPVGSRFCSWTVLAEAAKRSNNGRYWLCRCDCGTEREVQRGSLLLGSSQSCGCVGRAQPVPVGQRFGHLVIEGPAPSGSRGVRWMCRCDCGALVGAYRAAVRCGDKQTCGCRMRAHGLSDHPLYSTWNNIRERCLNPECASYYNYGATGVTVCERWADRKTGLAAFIEDMGEKPGSAYSIDRIDPGGPYSPTNCRWATRKQQRANQRRLPRVRVDLLRRASAEVGISGQDLDAALALIAEWAPNLLT